MAYFIPKEIEFVIKSIKNAGFDAYLVGGCVRDMLSNITPHDYDIATSATPGEIRNLFEKTADTGLKHGTVTVIVNKIPVEVTTFRCEGEYSDSRHPDTVSFVRNIDKDLSRRDFTVNALAYYPPDDTLIDLFEGAKDLKNKILRAVGDPDRRFSEDALRILRLFRFASVLDYEIEERTFNSAIKHADLLKKVSAERITAELKKAVMGKSVSVLTPLIKSGALNHYKITKSSEIELLERLPMNPDLRFFAFLKLSSDNTDASLNLLKVSNNEKHYSKSLNYLLSNKLPDNKSNIKHLLSKTSIEEFKDALIYKKIIYKEDTQVCENLLEEISGSNEPYRICDLAINGNDLIKQGYSGEEIRHKLNELLEFIIENPKMNKKDFLIKKL